MYDRLGELKKQHQYMEKKDFNAKTVTNNDVDWLIEQAEKLDSIAKAWVRIEERNEQGNSDDFYNEVQDILSETE